MQHLPSIEERQWLTHALKKLIVKCGAQLLDGAPLVEPTNEWFPEKWAATARHGHRLAQRLLHYAGLDDLRPTLSAYEPMENEDGSVPWDAGTAGWFAGIEERRAHFGLHVGQFSDPEAAAGVLAHEVAHAFRTHHRLIVDDREKEELLTDLTTVALGFGILSTNNTDRYRSSGTWDSTSWSVSSVGYLPPQAMAYLLALWTSAREKPRERAVIERHLEPNQRAFFRAALDELAESEKRTRQLLGVEWAPTSLTTVVPSSFTPAEPTHEEISEPEYEGPAESNRGLVVYRKLRGEGLLHGLVGSIPGALVGFIAGLTVFGEESLRNATLMMLGGALLSGALLFRRSRREVCSACATSIDGTAICHGCGGTVGGFATERDLLRIRLEELERAAAKVDYDECEACEPECPCDEHAATEGLVLPQERWEREDEPEATETAANARGRVHRGLTVIAALTLLVAGSVAWWRQNRIPVYFDNALGKPLVLQIDDESIPLEGRLAVLRRLKPGTHRIIVRDGARELERFNAEIRPQDLLAALLEPRFFIYSAASAGIYERSRLVYSTREYERATESTLIGLERWIEQPAVDYQFRPAPDVLQGRKATKTVFEIAHDVGFRELAFTWLMEGRNDDALRALRKGLELSTCDEGLRAAVVNLAEISLPPDAAMEEATAWVGACDASIEAHRAYQNLLRANGKHAELLVRYRERLHASTSASSHYLYGRLLPDQAAMSAYREALRLDPSFAWARVALGVQLLAAEQDAEAFATLSESLGGMDVNPAAPLYFAWAAIGAGRVDEALARLSDVADIDGESAWWASWMLVRSKSDWNAAKVLLADRERGNSTPDTRILRAKLDWESGGPRQSILANLRNDPATAASAALLTFEDALENGRFRDAAAMTELPDIYLAYAGEAALLAGIPADIQVSETFAAALLNAARGRMNEKALMEEASTENVNARAHAWFALAVHAATAGDRSTASQLFRKAAERALDREFPYRVALALAERYER